MLFLKTFKDAKFVVDGNAFQTFIVPFHARATVYFTKTCAYTHRTGLHSSLARRHTSQHVSAH